MDPICEQKIAFLQKYIPYLANLIKLLANDSEKEGKLAQMQLLYDLLNKPDNSVKIETLEKCEEVLSRVFGNADEKHDEIEMGEATDQCIPEMEKALIKCELEEETEGSAEQEKNFEVNCENVNGCSQQTQSECNESKPSESNVTSPVEKNTEETNPQDEQYKTSASKEASPIEGNSEQSIHLDDSDKSSAHNEPSPVEENPQEVNSRNDLEKSSASNEASHVEANPRDDIDKEQQTVKENSTDKTDAGKVESNPNLEAETSSKTESIKTTTKDNADESTIEIAAEETETANTISEEDHVDNSTITASEETQDKSTEEVDSCEVEKEQNGDPLEQDSPSAALSDTTEGNLENSYLTEDVNSQVDESGTFILPDDGEQFKATPEDSNGDEQETEAEEIANCEDQEDKTVPECEPEEQQTDVIMQSHTDMLPFKIISAESLAIQSVQSLSENDNLSLLQPIESDGNQENSPDDSDNQTNDTAEKATQNAEDLDPLDLMDNPPENLLNDSKSVPVENGSASGNHESKEDDDDDVLLIETRSSPICIDSDPEDEESLKQNRSLPIIPSKTIQAARKPEHKLQRPNARKSTSAVMDTIRSIIRHQNVSLRKISCHKRPRTQRDSGFLLKKDPKALMETINLIDSDSEDEKRKRVPKSKANDDDVIIVSSTQPQRKVISTKKTSPSLPAKQNPRLPAARLAGKPTPKPPTAQSNFLNAVNLQPAPKSNSNPASFSAQLSNKKVIIPNAFYGNPSYNRKPSTSVVIQDESSSNDSMSRKVSSSSTVSIRQVQDRVLKEWLEGFLTNFASPLQLASHACFVLLQRVLKYRFFQRLKETRVHLNTMAKNFVSENMDVQMLLDLRNVFLENDNLTEAGRRFCRFATNEAFGKPVALTTDSRTGKVTCRTRIGSKADVSTEKNSTEQLKTSKPSTPDSKAISVPQVPSSNATVTCSNSTKATVTSSNSTKATVTSSNLTKATVTSTNSTKATVTSSNSVHSTPITPVSNVTKRNRKLRKLSDGIIVADNDDNDYTPYMGELVLEDEVVTERKKSLRTNRTKRKEAGFTYSEDHDDEEFEALAKKIEDKKMEELRLAEERELEKEREKERRLKKTVAKKTTSKRQTSTMGAQMDVPREPTRKKLRLADTEILGNADDDLLTPTWVEADGDDGEVDSLLDFADEPQSPEPHASENDNSHMEDDQVVVAAEDSEDVDASPPSFDVGTNKLLKNTDRALHSQSQSFDFCVHCLRRVPRTVHHYVNEHRASEVFTSRLRTKDIRRLLTTSNVGFVHLYKGNQQQYAAHCIFCDKEAKFLLPYWFEHFTMHTGEYSFKCSGCHILKPTRSLLTNHLQSGSGCPKKGTAVRLHTFDTKSNQIEAHICVVCNYIQVHRNNVLRHLRTQHGMETVLAHHIIRVVLLQVSGPYRDQDTITNDESQLSLLQHSDEEENGINGSSYIDENSLMIQNDFTDNDDLSFMICGMLDVQTNLSATGDLVGNVDTINTVDNK